MGVARRYYIMTEYINQDCASNLADGRGEVGHSKRSSYTNRAFPTLQAVMSSRLLGGLVHCTLPTV